MTSTTISNFRHRLRLLVAILSVFLALPSVTSAIPKIPRIRHKPDITASSYDDYLRRVRNMIPSAPETTGSLWVSSGSLSALARDYKARNPGDLIVIHLSDTFTAAASAENKQSRQFSSNSSINSIFGTTAGGRLQNLFNAGSAHNLDGKGASTMSSNVTLDLAAQVMESLPNGTLVVQASRDVTVGNDRQTVLIRGLVRPGDLAPDNSVPSASISDLEVEIKGKGAVADASRNPNIVIRTLLRLFSF